VPIYEYECHKCKERSQRLQKLGEDSSGSKCLTCGDGRISKVISQFGLGAGGQSCASDNASRFR